MYHERSRSLKKFYLIMDLSEYINPISYNSIHISRFDKEGLLWFPDGSHVTVSRRKKEEVLKALGKTIMS